MDRWPSVKAALFDIIRVLSPVIYGLMFAYLLNKIMSFFESKLISKLINRLFRKRESVNKTRLTRGISVALTVIITLLIFRSLILLVMPQLLNSLQTLVLAMPGYINVVIDWLESTLDGNPLIEDAAVNYAGAITDQFTNWLQNTLLPQAETIVANVIGGAYSVFMTIARLVVGFVISIYVIYHKERFAAQSKKVVYGVFGAKKGNRIVTGAEFLDKSCGSFLTARLIDALIVGLLCYIFMIIAGMPYPMLIAVIVGVTNIVPFFGPFIGGIPSALIILMINPTQCLIFSIFIVILQQLDGNLIYPKIQGTTIGLSGFWIIVSLMVFSGFFGFWGMLLGVPIFTVIYATCRGAVENMLDNRGMPTETSEYRKISIFDAETNEPLYKTEVEKNKSENGKRNVLLQRKNRK